MSCFTKAAMPLLLAKFSCTNPGVKYCAVNLSTS